MDSASISKGSTTHVEAIEVETTPTLSPEQSHTPQPEKPSPWSSFTEFTESLGSSRASARRASIVQERFFPESSEETNSDDISNENEKAINPEGQPRRGVYKKEVMMPAWQFFSLIRTTSTLFCI
jgi:hypothetical protein